MISGASHRWLVFSATHVSKCIRSVAQNFAASICLRRTRCASVDYATGRGVLVDLLIWLFLNLTIIHIYLLTVADASLNRQPLHRDRKSTRLNSSHVAISYAVFC